jgi:hypothetical protein
MLKTTIRTVHKAVQVRLDDLALQQRGRDCEGSTSPRQVDAAAFGCIALSVSQSDTNIQWVTRFRA